MKISELNPKEIKIKYGPIDEPDKYTIDVLGMYVEEIYKGYYKEDHLLDDTDINYTSNLSSIPYSKTDRSTMPPWYLCMGSLPVYFRSPSGSVSPFALVVFRHDDKENQHLNTYVWWRKPDGSSNKCFTKDIHGHDDIALEKDIAVSLVLGEERVCQGIIPGKRS